MRQLKVKFRGGPLDGSIKTTDVPDHWEYLRLEERQGNRCHRYSGPTPLTDTQVELVYGGCEVLSHEH